MDTQQTTKRRRGGQPGNRNARTHGFYSARAAENDRDSIPDALNFNRLDVEIALLRLKIRRIVSYPDAPPELLFRAVGALARAMQANESINKYRL